MWTGSYSQRVTGVPADKIWRVWTDVNRWTEWQDDIESAKLEGPFIKGAIIHLRPKGGPNVKVELLGVEPLVNFTDLTRFPLAEMTVDHDLVRYGDELEIRTSIKVTGALAFLWSRIVAKDILASLPEQTRRLIERAKVVDKAPAVAA